jgi:hypothetical protein
VLLLQYIIKLQLSGMFFSFKLPQVHPQLLVLPTLVLGMETVAQVGETAMALALVAKSKILEAVSTPDLP